LVLGLGGISLLQICILVYFYVSWRHRDINRSLVFGNWKRLSLGKIYLIIPIKLKFDIRIYFLLGNLSTIYETATLLLGNDISLTVISIVHYSILYNALLELSSYNGRSLSANNLRLKVYWPRLLYKNRSWVSDIDIRVLIIFNFCIGLRLVAQSGSLHYGRKWYISVIIAWYRWNCRDNLRFSCWIFNLPYIALYENLICLDRRRLGVYYIWPWVCDNINVAIIICI
jgi:hypothetical protein